MQPRRSFHKSSASSGLGSGVGGVGGGSGPETSAFAHEDDAVPIAIPTLNLAALSLAPMSPQLHSTFGDPHVQFPLLSPHTPFQQQQQQQQAHTMMPMAMDQQHTPQEDGVRIGLGIPPRRASSIEEFDMAELDEHHHRRHDHNQHRSSETEPSREHEYPFDSLPQPGSVSPSRTGSRSKSQNQSHQQQYYHHANEHQRNSQSHVIHQPEDGRNSATGSPLPPLNLPEHHPPPSIPIPKPDINPMAPSMLQLMDEDVTVPSLKPLSFWSPGSSSLQPKSSQVPASVASATSSSSSSVAVSSPVSASGSTPRIVEPLIPPPSPTRKQSFRLNETTTKKILVIYCGGTIGMVKDPLTGSYAPNAGFLERLLTTFPEFQDPCMPRIEYTSFDPPLDSSDMSFEHWSRISVCIGEYHNDFDGFVVLHGTDTMVYTSSALSFMLENLSKPVVFTGSQIPLCIVRSDALQNLIDSFLVAAYSNVPEVMIVFHSEIWRANRTTKFTSWGVQGFSSFNFPRLGSGGLKLVINQRRILPTPPPTKPFRFHRHLSQQVVLLSIFPGVEKYMRHILLGIVNSTSTDNNKSADDAISSNSNRNNSNGNSNNGNNSNGDSSANGDINLSNNISSNNNNNGTNNSNSNDNSLKGGYSSFRPPPIRGVVLEAYGSGNCPARSSLLSAIAEACARGIVVVVTSSCLEGNVVLDIYNTGMALKNAGAISGLDMTTECAFVKLAFLLGQNLPVEQVRERMQQDLAGELTTYEHPMMPTFRNHRVVF